MTNSKINNFLNFVKNECEKSKIGLEDFNRILNVQKYDITKYNCELVDLSADIKTMTNTFTEVFSKEYFELKHPIYNNVLTRAVDSKFSYGRSRICYIFFIDKENKFPWISCGIYGLGELIITDKGFFSIIDGVCGFSQNIHHKWLKYICANDLYKILLNYPYENYFFKQIKFGIHLANNRPYHHFYDSLSWIYLLNIKNKKCFNKSFFIPRKHNMELINDSKDTKLVFIDPKLRHLYTKHTEYVRDMTNFVYKEAIESIVNVKIEYSHDLTIWLGIPGERRNWLTQLEGIPNILKNIAKYFPKIKVYVDGMTAHDGEKIEVANNLKAFTAIKAEVDKLNLDIDMESLSGYDYRSKICYCSTCDIAISDTGTTSLVPFEVCKKPGVIFFASETYAKKHIELIKNQIPSIFVIDVSFLKSIANKEDASYGFDFHIPWQHLYNLTAQSLEEIKGIKMHRLDVPPVELVAKQYDLEKKLNIKIPIESIALFDEVKQELNKISKEQKSNKELLAQIISSSMILQNYVNKKNLQDQSIINQNKNLIAELLYCKEQNSILEQKLAPKAKSRIHNQLSYKLGQAMIENSKSIWGYIRMPY
ncbi:MAG: hypothetical protein IKC25_03030, partial [Campylobacter sp.]|nr:hypothetical protein [Campylobacter sp.]